MDSCEWVLDTWLLEVAQTPSDPRSLDALALLHQIKARHRIAIDHDREIWRQYTKHVQANSHVGVWVRFMIGTSNKIFWRAGRVSSRHEDGLVSILRFDRADLVFVGVASNGPDRLIVSEDSDYSPEIRTYLETNLGVVVLSVREALDRALDP